MAVSKLDVRVIYGEVNVAHNTIPAYGYGWIGFSVPNFPGRKLVTLVPISNDPAITLTIGYPDGDIGWYLIYQSAYNGTAAAGNFKVRYAFM